MGVHPCSPSALYDNVDVGIIRDGQSEDNLNVH